MMAQINDTIAAHDALVQRFLICTQTFPELFRVAYGTIVDDDLIRIAPRAGSTDEISVYYLDEDAYDDAGKRVQNEIYPAWYLTADDAQLQAAEEVRMRLELWREKYKPIAAFWGTPAASFGAPHAQAPGDADPFGPTRKLHQSAQAQEPRAPLRQPGDQVLMPVPQRPEAVSIAIAWERAKGELRAAVAGLGALPPVYGSTPFEDPPSRWRMAHNDVEAFIKAMDDEERFCV